MSSSRLILPLMLLSILSGCGEKSSPTPASGPHIYMSGFANNSALYWKDRSLVTLDPAENATGITVQGTDVYVCGNRSFPWQGGTADMACYWKNGVRVDLSNPPSYANAIALLGKDVFVVGSATVNDKYVAVYWKNGALLQLSTENRSLANGITVYGMDFYVAGFDGQAACYWKNGIKTILDPDPASNAYAVAVNGGDVYVAGNIYTQWLHRKAVYWKNGVLTRLETGRNDSLVVDTYANGIGVDADTVHVSGWINAYDAVYWKNGAMKFLNNPARYVNAAQNKGNLFLFGHTPYVSLNTADYWYNDTVHHVASGYGTGIFVTPQ